LRVRWRQATVSHPGGQGRDSRDRWLAESSARVGLALVEGSAKGEFLLGQLFSDAPLLLVGERASELLEFVEELFDVLGASTEGCPTVPRLPFIHPALVAQGIERLPPKQ
jgi:hypothetical protein